MKPSEKLNIIHLDMDAFYASVEEQDNPKLKGRPVIVGGPGNRGIVTTANYEARKYGIHSAMPIYIARRKCPAGCFVPTRMERYKEVSKEIFNILYSFTDLIEPISIDEAYINISDIFLTDGSYESYADEFDIFSITNGSNAGKPDTSLSMDGPYTGTYNIKRRPLKIAMSIKEKVVEATGLTMSVGISYNKFLAKLASDWNKPDGIKIITEDMIPDILLPLPVKSVYGIGPKSSKRLNNIGIYTIKDLLALPEKFLIDFFGKLGTDIYYRIRGIDNRKINIEREKKSIGIERTLKTDTGDRNLLKRYLHKFATDLELSLKKSQLYGKTITLKLKDENFKLQTKSKTLDHYINLGDEILAIGTHLLDEINMRKNIRLIGLTVSNLTTVPAKQLSLFGSESHLYIR